MNTRAEAPEMQAINRLVLPLADWPAQDRALWVRAVADGNDSSDVEDDGLGSDIPSGHRYAASIAPITLRGAQKGCGRFLCVLSEEGGLDPKMPPADRVTPDTLDVFVRKLKVCGNRSSTIVGRLWALRSAMAVLAPDRDFGWLRSPGGVCLWSLVSPAALKEPMANAKTVMHWCRERLEAALVLPSGLGHAVTLRNGLIISLLTTRAPRLHSLALMRLGRQFLCQGERFRIVYRPEDLKNRKRLEYELPEWLHPAMRGYLKVERPFLLAGRSDDHLWIGQAGESLGQSGIKRVIRRATKARFGKAFGPHAFRTVLTTAMAEADPANPGAAAALLGHSPAVSEAYYNRAKADHAALSYQRDIAHDRERLRGLAERAFEKNMIG